MIALLCLIAAFPQGSVLVEAESFEIAKGWVVGQAREDTAPGGLSGGAAINSNEATALAFGQIDLPGTRYAVWARVYDWAGVPHRYQFDLRVGEAKRSMGASEPLVGGFVWEKWGEIEGRSALEIELSNADAFNSVCDAILFTPDLEFTPLDGLPLDLIDVQTSSDPATGDRAYAVHVAAETELLERRAKFTLLRRTDATGKVSPYVLWEQEVPLASSEGSRDFHVNAVVPKRAAEWPGTYELRLCVPNTAWHQGHTVAVLEGPDAAHVAPVRARIEMRHGAPALLINDAWQNPFAYLAAAGDFDRQFTQFHEIGGRFFSVYGEIGNGPDGFDSAACDGPFFQLLKSAPDALVFPRIDLSAPAWWLARYPEERVVFDDGSTGLQSFFSERWLEEAEKWLEAYARYVRSAPYRGHVIGVHICTGYTGEWQSWGLWDDRRGDFSEPAKGAWVKYLARKYGTDEAISRAWGRAVTLAQAPMPDRERREKAGMPMFRVAPQEQDIIDFYDYYWRGVARAIQGLAAAAKRGGGPDFLVGVFYGYFAQYGGKVQESQHLGLREVMDCPDIDFFCSPAMYSDRGLGGTSTFMSLTDSLRIRGKFWWDEADNRTHLAPDTLARAGNEFETLNVLEREFAHAHTRRTGIWWFDMQGGWYDAPAVLDRLGEFRRFGEMAHHGWEPEVEVAVYYDDKSTYRVAPEATFMNELPSFFAGLPRLGAPYHTYLLSDLAEAPRYKLNIFVNAFDLTDEERREVETVLRDGRSAVFFGPAGIGRVSDGQVVHDPALSEALLGLTSESQDWSVQPRQGGYVAHSTEGNPSIELVRSVAKLAGVHLYAENHDALYVGNGLISVHAAEAGEKTLFFPRTVVLCEVFPETEAAIEGREFRFTFEAHETRSFHVRQAK